MPEMSPDTDRIRIPVAVQIGRRSIAPQRRAVTARTGAAESVAGVARGGSLPSAQILAVTALTEIDTVGGDPSPVEIRRSGYEPRHWMDGRFMRILVGAGREKNQYARQQSN